MRNCQSTYFVTYKIEHLLTLLKIISFWWLYSFLKCGIEENVLSERKTEKEALGLMLNHLKQTAKSVSIV